MRNNWKRTFGNRQNRANLLLFIILLLLIIFLYFKLGAILAYVSTVTSGFSSSLSRPSLDLSQEQSQEKYDSCYDLCKANDFNSGYGSYTETAKSCKSGETFATWGMPGEVKDLYCCCVPYSEKPVTSPCIDSDGGKMFNTGGKVTTALGNMYDTCQPNGMDLLEFYCENDVQKSTGIGCPNGCIDSPSGDYCSPNKIWHAGDTVFSGTGTGTLVGTNSVGSLDLSEYGITVGGTCRLGAQIQTSWSYDNPVLCQGVWGVEGLKLDFYDSNGLEYTRTDPAPMALGVDLHPEAHILEWDGVNLWQGYLTRVPGVMQNCVINYEYSLRVYIYDC